MPPVTMAEHIVIWRKEEMANTDRSQLRMYWLSSRGQPIRISPPTRGMAVGQQRTIVQKMSYKTLYRTSILDKSFDRSNQRKTDVSENG